MRLVSQEMISDLYNIYCGRPADPEGLAFWLERLSHFTTKEEAVVYFGRASDMGQSLVADETTVINRLDSEEVMSTLLERAFLRAPTLRERAYYLAQLASGTWEPIELAWELINKATGEDSDKLNAKLSQARIELQQRQERADPNFIARQTLPTPILIGAHHKTGTNWLSAIFRTICDNFNFIMLEGESPVATGRFDIFFQDHSAFDENLLKQSFRGLHMIRDPRDVIISGCFYHQHASESWLHIKRKRFGGLSYQEKLNSYSEFSDQLLFEMEHISLLTIKDMWAWDYHSPAFHEVKYETLIRDTELTHFREMFVELGMDGEELLPHLQSIARDNSLFSGKVKTNHVRSGNAQQWPHYFDARLKRRFLELYGNVLIDLAYEADHDWAELEAPLSASSPECANRTIADVLYHPDDESDE